MSSKKMDPDYRPNQGSVYLITGDGRTLQLPIPSNSTNDPLKWSQVRRSLALAAMSLFTVFGLIAVQGTSLLLEALEKEYNPGGGMRHRVDLLSSIPTSFWGIGAAIWVPLSLAIGRRPVFLLATVILTVSMFMAAVSQSFQVHLLARCLQGLAGAVSPSTMILMIIDMTFIHQRPLYIALFWCLTTVFSNIGLALTPFIISAGGSWRAFYWAWLGPSAVTIVLALLWSPETYFKRSPMKFEDNILAQAESGKVTLYSTWEEVPGGKPLPTIPHMWSTGSWIKRVIFWNRTAKGGWAEMSDFPRQLLICTLNPLILWVLVLNAFVFGTMIITCATYAQVLGAAPYNFSSNAIGLAKLSPGIGALLAFLASSFLTDYIVRRLAARNRGVREPEHYLPSFISPVVMSSLSLVLFGVAAERQWDWRWILLFVGINYLAAISIFTSNTLWVTEAFPRWAAPALVIVGAGGYGLSFGLNFGVVAWIASQGLERTYIQLAIITFSVGLLGLPINFYGRRFRSYIYSNWDR